MRGQRDPHEDKGEYRSKATDQNIEAFRTPAMLAAIRDIAHHGIGHRIPEMAEKRDKSGKSCRNTQGFDEKNRKKGVDDHESAAAKKLGHTIHQASACTIADFCSCHFFLHKTPLLRCSELGRVKSSCFYSLQLYISLNTKYHNSE